MSTVRIQTSEGTLSEVPKDFTEKMITLRNIIQDMGGATEEAIPLSNISYDLLNTIFEFYQLSLQNPDAPAVPVNPNIPDSVLLPQWQITFFSAMPQTELLELIMVVNYLDYPELLDASTKYAASQIQGKTTEEIRRNFNIVNDFTPEEEAAVRAENAWMNQ